MNINWTDITLRPETRIYSTTGQQTAERDLNLQPGQAYQGKVTGRVGDNLYTVQVDGKNATVQSPYALPENTTIAFEVEGQKDGQYKIRLLDSGPAVQDKLLQNIIRQLGIQDTTLNRALISEFVAQELPLRPDMLKQAEKMVQKLGDATPENISTAVLSLKTGIPVDSRVMEALRSFLAGQENVPQGSEQQLSVLLPKLVNMLSGKNAAGQPDGNISPARTNTAPLSLSGDGNTSLRRVMDLLQSLVLKPDEGPAKLAGQLRSLISTQLPSAGPEQATLPQAGLTGVTGQQDIEDTTLNQALVQGFISRGIPVKAELIQIAGQMVPMLGADTAENVETVLTALQRALAPQDSITVINGEPNIEDTPLNHTLVQGFMSRGIPIKAELIQIAGQMVVMLGADTAKNVETVLTALQSILLPEAENGNILLPLQKDFSFASPDGTQKLAGFMHKLSAALNSSPDTDPAQNPGDLLKIKLSPEGKQIMARLQELMQTATRTGNTLSPDIPENNVLLEALRQVSVALGSRSSVTDMQKEIFTPGSNTVQAEDASARIFSTDKQGNVNNTAQTATIKKQLTGLALPRGRAFSELLENFSQLLQEVRKAVQEAGNPPQARQLLQEGTMIERQMAGQQIFQSFIREYNQQNYLYFNIPFIQNGDKETWGQLRIIREGDRSKAVDPENFGVALLLNTDNIGTVLVELKVREKNVTASGKVTEGWIADLLTTAWPQLQESLDAQGYQLQQCNFKVGQFNDNLRPSFTVPAESGFNLHSLDITV
ncbi:MAG: hypothetical protein VR69_03360 [Peptococcaceae bacterium BRH_c4b]|nr:MAG: hypothetical protein VR69_03360 [Peptococcaceae bacterium BRH_c4b]